MRSPAYQELITFLADHEPRFCYELSNLPTLTPGQIALVMRDDPDEFDRLYPSPIVGADCIEQAEQNTHIAAVRLLYAYLELILPVVRSKLLRDVELELLRRELQPQLAEA